MSTQYMIPKLQRQKALPWWARGWEWRWIANAHEGTFWNDRSFLKLDYGKGYTPAQIY